MPRITTIVITMLFCLLIVSFLVIGVLFWRNCFLEYRAKHYAEEAADAEAIRHFLHGHMWLYKIKLYKYGEGDSGPAPTDGVFEPTDETTGPFQIYSLLVDAGYPAGHQKIQQVYIDRYNEQMHLLVEHPEMFDKNGQRIPWHDLPTTNAISTAK